MRDLFAHLRETYNVEFVLCFSLLSHIISAADVFAGARPLFMGSMYSKPEQVQERDKAMSTPLVSLARVEGSAYLDLTVLLQSPLDPTRPVRAPTVRLLFS